MKNLKFKYLKAENFICFESLEIDFEKFGNIVSIQGRNLDVTDQDNINANNGIGKSSIMDAISYALYGKTIKKPKKISHGDVVNNKNCKKLSVEIRWDDFRVIRTRKADGKTGDLKMWKSDKGEWNKDTFISLGGSPATQERIEVELGLTYEAFSNIAVFSDDNTMSFLECDAAAKRQIVENLLSLEKYNTYFQTAKDQTKDLKDEIKTLSKEYEVLDAERTRCESRIQEIDKQESDWRIARKKELNNLLNEIKSKTDELENSKTGVALIFYQQAQEQIADLKTKVEPLETNKEKLNLILAEATSKIEKVNCNITTSLTALAVAKKDYESCEKVVTENRNAIKDVENKTGKECPYCLSVIDQKNFQSITDKANSVLQEQEPKLVEFKKVFDEATSKHTGLLATKKAIDNGITDLRNRITALNSELSGIHCSIAELSKVEKPDSTSNEIKLGEQIDNLKKQVIERQEQLSGTTPFEEIKQSAMNDLKTQIVECDAKKKEIKAKDDELPYYEFWVKAFGDTGIRKYIIDKIIPTLNSGIEYWLQFLIDNKIKLSFNDELEETIDRYPYNSRPYVYHGMSGGQRRRLNLSVSQAFAYVMMLNCGASPSFVFLDEVSINIDEAGVQGIYRMICELAKDKQVFIIDHNPVLLEMLSGCDQIYLEMKDEVSKRVDKNK